MQIKLPSEILLLRGYLLPHDGTTSIIEVVAYSLASGASCHPNVVNPNRPYQIRQSISGLQTMDYMIREAELLRRELLSISNDIRRLMRSKEYKKLYYLLRTITGIGPLTAASLITEIGDMNRFANFYHLNSFIGLLPTEHSSDERESKGRLTIRRHRQLRSDLTECAWTAKRTDPALSLFYSEQLKKGKEPKLIIIKIARKLLSRIRYVWLSEKPYEKGVVK